LGTGGETGPEGGRRMTAPQTLFGKLWAAHEVMRRDDGTSLLWVDRHLVH